MAYRSSAAILGVAFIQNIYGEGHTAMAALMMIGSVPLYNILLPGIPKKVISDVGKMATPLGLIAMGAMFDPAAARKKAGPAIAASLMKLLVLEAVFLPAAVVFGFRGQQLVALTVMLGSASTVACYVMATSMGHEGTLTSSTVMMTTAGCSFSLALWLYILKSLALI